jgi:hypothetical protein
LWVFISKGKWLSSLEAEPAIREVHHSEDLESENLAEK